MHAHDVTAVAPAYPDRPGLVARLRAALRRVFGRARRDPLADHDETFAPIDIDRVRGELRLGEEARRFGARDLPHRDDPTPDGPQIRVTAFITEQVDEAFRRANRELERLTDAIRGRDVHGAVERAERLPAELATRTRTDVREANQHVRTLDARRREVRQRVSAFRERHGIARGPELTEPQHRKVLLASTIGLAVVQALANATLFAQGMTFGLSAGLFLAIGLGFFDIGHHFTLGRVATRVHGRGVFNRAVGALFLVLVTASAAFYNLGLVHLRIGIRERGFTDGVNQWWPQFRGDPLGFTDFGSFALLAIGLMCTVLAVVSAWNWDEPIPEYRRLGRRLRELDGDLGHWRDRAERIVQDAVDEGREELERLHDDIDHALNTSEALLHRMTRLKENLSVFVRDAEHAHAVLVRTYRDENRLARQSPPPRYFEDAPSVALEHPLAVDVAQIRRMVEAQRELQAKLRAHPVDLQAYLEHKLRDDAGRAEPE
jgi:hypothetical protein